MNWPRKPTAAALYKEKDSVEVIPNIRIRIRSQELLALTAEKNGRTGNAAHDN